jgi:pimeloyl-ACP methyl ester carboxylesterase
VAALGIAFYASYAGFVRFWPLEAARWSTYWELRSGNVETIVAGGLHGYYRDTCAPGSKAEFGKCSCLVLVHGLGDEALTWKRILLMEPKEWANGVRLYAFDLPGSGSSEPPLFEKDYRVRKMAEHLGQALDAVQGCDRWIAVGNSLGGWVASWLALDWGKTKVNRLILVDSAGLKASTQAEGGASLLGEPTIASLKEFQKRAYFKPRPIPEHIWRAIAARAAQGNSRKVIAAQTEEDFLDTYLPALRRPTFVFWGTADRVIPLEQGRYLTTLIPGAQLHQAPDCGHLPQKECPAALMKTLNGVIRFGTM